MGHHNFDSAGELANQLAVKDLVDHLNEEDLKQKMVILQDRIRAEETEDSLRELAEDNPIPYVKVRTEIDRAKAEIEQRRRR